MPRPERPLDPEGGPIAAFAHDLRRLREKAGRPKYLQMARKTGRSRTALTEAAGGDHIPTWDTVRAYVTACGGDPDAWLGRWEELRESARAVRSEPPAPRSTPGPEAARAVTAQQGIAPAGPSRNDHRDADNDEASDIAILLRLWQEQRNQARQCENHRAMLSSMIVLACTAAAAGSLAVHSARIDVCLDGAIVALGIFGALACHKYYERHQMHMTEAQALRRQLSSLRPRLGIESGWRDARAEHHSRYPVVYQVRLHQLWVAIHLIVALVGVLLGVAAATR
jgi:Helix-turn-helix domain